MKFKFTPISILLGLLLIISGITSINGLLINNSGGNSLGGGIAFIFFVIVGVILFVEQNIVQNSKASSKKIWLVEIVSLVPILLLLFVMFKNMAR